MATAAKRRERCEQPRSEVQSGPQSHAHHGLPTVKASAVGGTPGGQEAAEAGEEPGQNLLRAGQAAPEGTLASGPSLGEWVTLYILCFAGNGDEKTVVVCYPLETPQRPGILRICPASQIGNGQR